MADVPALGDPVTRVDAIAKVTGTASFPSDVPAPDAAFAVLVTSTVAKARIAGIDDRAARAVPGFRLLLTHENTKGEVQTPRAFAGNSTTTVEDDRVMHDGQIIGLVVADSFESACEAAERLVVRYAEQTPSAGFDQPGAERRAVHDVDPHHEDPGIGDADAAFAAAPLRVDAEYRTPTQHHNAMELLTTTCWWSGNRLTVHEPSQFVLDRGYLATCFNMPVDDIRVVSRFCGGGFGGKSSGTPRTVLVAIAARRLGRPVKLVTRRDQGFTINTYRAETRHRLRLAATRDGRLRALIHEGEELTSRPSTYSVSGTEATARMYACPHVRTSVAIVHADRNTPGFMRCPAELPYMFALESAVDELAYALALDPIELRRRNDTQTDPIGGKPFSSRSLMTCFDRGAARFGWARRQPTPGAVRDGDWLVGLGCATACYPANLGASAARVALDARGRARVQVAFHEIGNGAYTVIAQTAAAALGLPVTDVAVELGDTLLPPGNIAAASNGTATTCNAVHDACAMLRRRLAETAITHEAAFGATTPDAIRMVNGALVAPDGARVPITRVIGQLGGMVEALGTFVLPGAPPGAIDRLRQGIPTLGGGAHAPDHLMFAFGANFVEVRVHSLTGQIHVPRMVGAFAAGRIMNRRTATSQLSGGMIWGMGAALHEQTVIDPASARYINKNLADYLIPVNADVGAVEVELVDEQDDRVNPLGIKGVGELGLSGMNAAVANAVFNATGRRLRSLPILPRHLV